MVPIIRVGVVGGVVALVVGAFAWAGGWLSPHAVTPARVVDTFEQVNGPHPGFRRNHAKGVGVRGTFHASGQGQRLSRASVFAAGSTTPVLGRFAFAGGMPYAPDSLGDVRSLAVRFFLPDGEEWRTGMIDIPVFLVRSGEAMLDLLVATAPDKATGKPDPAKLGPFFSAHPETQRALGMVKSAPHTSGFAASTYNALNSFVLVNDAGVSTPARWSLVPDAAGADVGTSIDAGAVGTDPNALFDALIARFHQGPLSWHLVMTLAGPGDAVEDPTVAWPPEREHVDVGTLTLDRLEAEEESEARTTNFDPLILPSGIAPSNDRVLSARSAAYSESLRRRLAEPVASSAVSPAEVAR